MRNRMISWMISLAMVPVAANARTSLTASMNEDRAMSFDQSTPDAAELAELQKILLGETSWEALTTEQRMVFLVITADAATLGVNLAGFTVSHIAVAGLNGEKQTELNLTATEPGAAAVAVNALEQSLRGRFTSWTKSQMVGKPHAGFTGNFRQNVAKWSMQINTNPQTGAVQIDIDESNPNSAAAPAHWLDVMRHNATHTDTAYNKVAAALAKRGVKVVLNGTN
jgi:hypothetical protein